MTDHWIEWHWTAEKPYPEGERDMVTVQYEDGEIFTAPVERFYWDAGDITHYKLA